MKSIFSSQLGYSILILAILISYGCLENDQISEIVNTPITEPDPLPAGEGLAVGATAPDFTLQDSDGNDVSLSDYAGKILVIQFFSDTF
ncbi:redoxin domain-containing protein [Candidatus Poribacteria bacterium]|nr:redoxin domain-containing protein [Candidatus Poribacteria bacterium]MYB63521.1 redoxin domain-containing protein [Candidatus Poribacteria bacterium]MYF55115.1 redoxin domain-containing protein [Candidatus Poribacteria bacterium]MYI95034.1 redoxin domain-containing protein [Candidatus Poribacteria bacterium]